MYLRTATAISFLLASSLVACGGSQGAPPASPEPEPESEAPVASDDSKESSAADEADAEESEADTEVASSERRQSPKEVLTAEGVLFAFSFNSSEAYGRADEKCSASAGDDPQKKAQCMTKFRDQFDADGIAFQKDQDGAWWWLTIRRRGKSASALHKIEFEFGDETEDTIKILPKGRDKGSKPMGRIPKEVTITVPNDSEIELTDPKHGKMVYQAKMGLIGGGAER